MHTALQLIDCSLMISMCDSWLVHVGVINSCLSIVPQSLIKIALF